jgi:hypothetical protein
MASVKASSVEEGDTKWCVRRDYACTPWAGSTKIKGIDPGILASEQRFHLVVDAPQSFHGKDFGRRSSRPDSFRLRHRQPRAPQTKFRTASGISRPLRRDQQGGLASLRSGENGAHSRRRRSHPPVESGRISCYRYQSAGRRARWMYRRRKNVMRESRCRLDGMEFRIARSITADTDRPASASHGWRISRSPHFSQRDCCRWIGRQSGDEAV